MGNASSAISNQQSSAGSTRYHTESKPPPALAKICEALEKAKNAIDMIEDKREVRAIAKRVYKREYADRGPADDLIRYLKKEGILREASGVAGFHFDKARAHVVIDAASQRRRAAPPVCAAAPAPLAVEVMYRYPRKPAEAEVMPLPSTRIDTDCVPANDDEQEPISVERPSIARPVQCMALLADGNGIGIFDSPSSIPPTATPLVGDLDAFVDMSEEDLAAHQARVDRLLLVLTDGLDFFKEVEEERSRREKEATEERARHEKEVRDQRVRREQLAARKKELEELENCAREELATVELEIKNLS